MRTDTPSTASILDFWNRRADLKQRAGSDDLIAKRLEIEAIARHVRDGMRIVEIGCGNGITALELAQRHDVEVTALDLAENMIAEARALADQVQLRGSVNFIVGDLRELPNPAAPFDLAYTERVLINLPDWSSQRQAIIDTGRIIAPGAAYIMCENSQDGLDRINELREQAGLKRIAPPWHNRYFRDAEIESGEFPGLQLDRIEHYSSTYYLLSRVVNAWLAAGEGKEPEYDAPVNQLALRLPPIGELGQGRIWVWRKLS